MASPRRLRLRASRDDGYAMAALLVGLSIMALTMTVAMPVWKQEAQREREAELVFRGQQYARAIGLFQRKNGPGTLPPTIDVLVDQRFLRKKYKDPITNDYFQPLLAGQPVLGTQPQAGAQGAPSSRGTGSPAAQPSSVGAGRAGIGSAPGSSTTPSRGAGGGIMGVASKSKDASIRIYQGRTHYNEWSFIYVAQAQAPGAVGAGGVPGVGGRSAPGGRGAAGPNGARGPFGPGGPQGPGGRAGTVSPTLPMTPQPQVPPRRPGG